MNMYDSGALFISQLAPTGNKPETFSLRGVEWTPIGSKIRQDPNPYGRDFYYHGDKSLGTDEGSEVPVMPRQNIEHDTFLDNEIGTVMRLAKAKFGKVPLIEAYKKVLNTSKKIDDRRKASLEEEVRLRSILKAGED
ncbi:MAG: hypothetical protein ACYDHX_16435 [Methanothrix sp.]